VASLSVAVQVKNKTHRNKIVQVLKEDLFSNPFRLSAEGLFPGSQQYTETTNTWLKPPEAMYCGDGKVQKDIGEVCDDGPASEFDACYMCICNEALGFIEDTLSGGCICNPTLDHSGAKIDAVETSSVQGEQNNVTFSVQLRQKVTGVNLEGEIKDTVVVTISGLAAATPTGELPISCKHALPSAWLDADGQSTCKLGLAPLPGSFAWRYDRAQWNQEAGTLKFTVLGALEGRIDPSVRRFQLTVMLQNIYKTGSERRPEVSVCKHRTPNDPTSYQSLGLYDSEKPNFALSATGYILGSTARKIRASSAVQTVEFDPVDDSGKTVLKVIVPGGSMPPNSELMMYCQEQDVDKGRTQTMHGHLPYKEAGDGNKTLVGASNIMLRMKLQDRTTKAVVPFLNNQVEVELAVDQAVVRQRGNCYTPDTNTLTVCLPGSVGLFRYIDSDSLQTGWYILQDVRQPDDADKPAPESRMYSTLRSKVPIDALDTSYVALAVSPCNDYNGMGLAGGDLICRNSKVIQLDQSHASLGGGTISKMPSIADASRPSIGSLSSFDSYLKSMAGGDVKYRPRKSWQLVDLSKYVPTCVGVCSPLPARYGHAMATVSGSRVLIYGGIGCSVWDNKDVFSSFFCLKTVLLNDLWELDLLKWTGSGNPVKQLNLSPVLTGLAGPSLVVIPGENHRVLMFGGSSITYPLSELMQISQNMSEEKFEYRELQFRGAKAVNFTLSGMEVVSFSSAASNTTHVMLLFGYLGNSRTAAVFTYSLLASSPDLALNLMLISATGPSARSMPGVTKLDDSTLLVSF